ncbi:tetratricopeptide repeat protein [Planctomycetota bacterium]
MALNVTISTDELHALLEAGFLLRERAEIDKAGDVFAGVIALRPDIEIAHLGLANILEIQGKDDEAGKILEELTKRSPSSAMAYMQLGEFYHTHEKKEEALKALDKAIELDAGGPFAESARAIKALVEEGVGYQYKMKGA